MELRDVRTKPPAFRNAANRISVKGKTNEGVDSVGAGESIAVHAVALVSKI